MLKGYLFFPSSTLKQLHKFTNLDVLVLDLFILKGGKEGEKRQFVVASGTTPAQDLAQNPGMCSDWESNQQPFGSQASA